MSLLEELREGIRRRKQQDRALGGRVLVFGPGDKKGLRKRRSLIRALKRVGFDAHMSEDLSKKVPSTIDVVEQEAEHLSHFDMILALNFSEGVGMELAAFRDNANVRRKTFIVYPEEWDPSKSKSFGSQVLRQYYWKERVSQEEWRRCLTRRRCLEAALNFRRLEAEMNRSPSPPPQ